ncbi:small nuclear ribonucleoprotein G-like protein [Cricetulus griseus]|nr:small nuclear ribonucleoprotein G-like protein [Cricetulus griseus]
MSKAHPPELKKFMDKKLSLKLNGGRHVQGILWGFDPFMNLVIDECVEMATSGQQNNIGMVVIRGNSIIMLEALERRRSPDPVRPCRHLENPDSAGWKIWKM